MSLRQKILTGAVGLVLGSSTLMVFLGKWEGEGQNVVYADKLAQGLPTVCAGITRRTSPYPVIVGDYWSPARCSEVEQLVVQKGQLALADCLTNDKISQNTFDALYSHGHNVGVPSTCASRSVGLINAANGNRRFVPGLHARRRAEAELCAS
ncbi:lysozyme [Pseudomonas sp. PCH446]